MMTDVSAARSPAWPFSLLVKPASADCNLRCAYCFYLDRAALYPEPARHRMAPAVLERLVASYMATDQPCYTFGWQGGEPTLMGPAFFRAAVDLQKRCGRPGALVANGLQTNAVLIDDELAALLGEYRFLVGVSLDGPPELHDRYRTTAAGGGSQARVLAGIDCLRRHRVEFNALVLVSSANVGHAAAVYRYLCGQGIFHHQYIPCVEWDRDGRPRPWSIDGRQWGDFLCALYDAWYPGDTRRVSVRLFDSVLTKLVDNTANVCHMEENCCQYFVVEYNGDVYPCDFFVDAPLRLGNIRHDDWAALQAGGTYAAFGRRKAARHRRCRDCPFLLLCAGDCLKHRPPPGAATLSVLCAGWEQFYRHALPGLSALARAIEDQRRAAAPRETPAAAPPGRNASCPCGSGRKYKHCCERARRRGGDVR